MPVANSVIVGGMQQRQDNSLMVRPDGKRARRAWWK